MKPGNVDLSVKKLHQSVVKDLLKTNKDEEKFKKSSYPSGSRRPLSRKEKRKVTREYKKAKNVAHNQGVQLATVLPQYLHTRTDLLDASKKKSKKKKNKKKSVKKTETATSGDQNDSTEVENTAETEGKPAGEKRSKEQKESDRQRLKAQRKLIKEDDKEIRKYAKRLGLTKRKSKNLPESFKAEGLDYLLDLIDQKPTEEEMQSDEAGNTKNSTADEDNSDADDFGDEEESEAEGLSGTDEEEPDELPSSKRKTTGREEPLKKVKFEDIQDDSESDDDELMESDTEEITPEPKKSVSEDIYGRVKGSDGNFSLRSDPETRMSLLRQLDDRATLDEKTTLTVKRLVKGVVNRLSESNVVSIVAQITGFFQSYNRSLVRTVLVDCLLSSCLKDEVLPQRLLLEHSLLVAIIYHSKEHSDQVCHMVESLVLKVHQLYTTSDGTTSSKDESSKSLNNGLSLIAHLYSLKVVGSQLVLDFLRLLVDNFSHRDVELLLSFVKDVGFVLRKDNPMALKEIITDVHKRVNSDEGAKLAEDSRVKFMLETLSAIKNNNIFKVLNYDPEMVEHFLKFLRGCIKGALETPLTMGLSDFLETETKGRWWIVGASWQIPSGPAAVSSEVATEVNSGGKSLQFSEKLLELAKRQHMNTDLRRNIFCVIMSADDYIDAFGKLLGLGLKDKQEREIVHITVDCCMQEKSFNFYYALLMQKFCEFHKRFLLTVQFALWDKIKLIDQLNDNQLVNLTSLLSNLIRSKAVSVAVLKVVEFGVVKRKQLRFIQLLFAALLKDSSALEMREIWEKVALAKKYKTFMSGVMCAISQLLEGEKIEKSSKESLSLFQQTILEMRNL